ncbi:MAG: ribose-5-phosphate isomerase RpiA [Chloroflexi bacterium]|nr:MAG: ribose-5-phosphate isomerase RpiA [Chloroflexota bacterium]
MSQDNSQQDAWKALVGEASAQLVEDGMVIGLGTGSTASQFIRALARRIQRGLRIVGAAASSQASQELAASLGIPITNLDTHPELDLYIDGADEIDPQLRLIKGAGGALLREKIMASAARRFVVIGDDSKLVDQLGHRYPLPVEVCPFAATPVRKQLEVLAASVQLRQKDGEVFMTENSNIIFDLTFPDGISNPVDLDERIQRIVGVVETGLFLQMAQSALIGGVKGVQTLP